MAFVAYKEVVKEHARRRNPDVRPQVEASRPPGADGVEAATSLWEADECNRVLGQESSEQERAAHADSVRPAGEKGWGAGEPFGLFRP